LQTRLFKLIRDLCYLKEVGGQEQRFLAQRVAVVLLGKVEVDPVEVPLQPLQRQDERREDLQQLCGRLQVENEGG